MHKILKRAHNSAKKKLKYHLQYIHKRCAEPKFEGSRLNVVPRNMQIQFHRDGGKVHMQEGVRALSDLGAYSVVHAVI